MPVKTHIAINRRLMDLMKTFKAAGGEAIEISGDQLVIWRIKVRYPATKKAAATK